MSTQTQHIGLHQWESADPFLREDFNQDHRLIDAAVAQAEGKADQALSGLEDVGYNVYNLLLQNYYEGKYTGFKKGLMFDGFLDGSRIVLIEWSENAADVLPENHRTVHIAYGDAENDRRIAIGEVSA